MVGCKYYIIRNGGMQILHNPQWCDANITSPAMVGCSYYKIRNSVTQMGHNPQYFTCSNFVPFQILRHHLQFGIENIT